MKICSRSKMNSCLAFKCWLPPELLRLLLILGGIERNPGPKIELNTIDILAIVIFVCLILPLVLAILISCCSAGIGCTSILKSMSVFRLANQIYQNYFCVKSIQFRDEKLNFYILVSKVFVLSTNKLS